MRKGRPTKPRLVRKEPKTRQFSPRGAIGRPGYAEIKYEELEAIRLADHTGLSQKECAANMGISQQTFSRVLKKGRTCLAEALIMGKIIRVNGGDFKLAQRT
jgi:predicted DNA-binding protein (UPF0251 family)